MAEGSKDDALPLPSSSGSLKHCSVCGVAVKEHLGPHGPVKCLVKLIHSLSLRIQQLESDNKRQAVELQEHAEQIERRASGSSPCDH